MGVPKSQERIPPDCQGYAPSTTVRLGASELSAVMMGAGGNAGPALRVKSVFWGPAASPRVGNVNAGLTGVAENAANVQPVSGSA